MIPRRLQEKKFIKTNFKRERECRTDKLKIINELTSGPDTKILS